MFSTSVLNLCVLCSFHVTVDPVDCNFVHHPLFNDNKDPYMDIRRALGVELATGRNIKMGVL